VKNRIPELRSELAWTQADLALRAGVSRQTINAIETGKFDPSLPVAFRLARLFGLTIEDLFTDEADRSVSSRRGDLRSDPIPNRVEDGRNRDR
jgi:putative transcriptional regulator